jgi:hypothetical protein
MLGLTVIKENWDDAGVEQADLSSDTEHRRTPDLPHVVEGITGRRDANR